MQTFIVLLLNFGFTLSVLYAFVGILCLILQILQPNKVIVDNPWSFILAGMALVPLYLIRRKVYKLRRTNSH